MSTSGPYQLINKVYAHDGPVRSITTYTDATNQLFIVTGCQSDAPHTKKWLYDATQNQLLEHDSCIYHDHWVTALTALSFDPQRFHYSLVHDAYLSIMLHLFNVVVVCITSEIQCMYYMTKHILPSLLYIPYLTTYRDAS